MSERANLTGQPFDTARLAKVTVTAEDIHGNTITWPLTTPAHEDGHPLTIRVETERETVGGVPVGDWWATIHVEGTPQMDASGPPGRPV